MNTSEGRPRSVAPDQPKPELSPQLTWVVSTLATLIRAHRGAAVIGALVLELARRRAGVTAVAAPAVTVSAMSVPTTYGMHLVIGEDLDDAVAHLVSFGAANALATAEPGGWASTTARVDELADTVADARINAALKWMDDRKLELIRRSA